jgi:hypothetical protein
MRGEPRAHFEAARIVLGGQIDIHAVQFDARCSTVLRWPGSEAGEVRSKSGADPQP